MSLSNHEETFEVRSGVCCEERPVLAGASEGARRTGTSRVVGLILWARGCDLVDGIVDGVKRRGNVHGFSRIVHIHND